MTEFLMQTRRPGGSALALGAGLIAVIALSMGTDAVLHATGVLPPWGVPLQAAAPGSLALAYRVAYQVLGSYLAARLAPQRPMGHALALGAIGLVLAIAGSVAMGNSGFGPDWYALALVATALPCAWAGGKLHQWTGQPA